MQRLPQELLREIVGLAFSEDSNPTRHALKDFRLLCKACAHAAAPLLFRDVPIWIGRQSLQNLVSLSEHPLLHQYVRKIMFSPLRFNEKDIKQSTESVKAKCEMYCPHEENIDGICATYASALSRYWDEQCSLTKDEQDLKFLIQAFKNLGNFTSLQIGGCYVGGLEIASRLGKVDGDELLMDGRYTLTVLFKALCAASKPLTSLTLGNEADPPYNAERPWWEMIPPVEVSAMCFDKNSFLSAFKVVPEDKRQAVFGSITELRMPDLNAYHQRLEPFESLMTAMRWIVQGCLHLETLDIGWLQKVWGRGLPPQARFITSLIPFDRYGHLAGLKSIKLDHMKGTIMEIGVILCTKCETLENVELTSVFINSPNHWAQLLKCLKGYDFHRLQTFNMNDCFKFDSRGKSVSAVEYIRGVTDVNPMERDQKALEAYGPG
ncbi:uncharacterized protein KY384_004701 [Bacidia gigantensis]|uniref:uncharacterized protein n=1 Tax=Bacidia gigantensis TaxID=2732470 RepID=UPI001D04CADF|nr:uncharacterized protein KY384_004701 [Bacidia gigantensis]KAG8530201.1 hypothetical protein KY384_004701 [Bacidia gigantensis]